MVLNGEYQYIGRSSPVGCPAGYGYYLLLYAKMEADTASGCHRVWVKTRLACDVNASFYALTTSGEASVAGVSVYGWQRQQIPYHYWGDSTALKEGGVTYPRWTELAEGWAELSGGFGPDREVTVEAAWQLHSTNSTGAGWFPNAGEVARGSIRVWLPGIPGASPIASAAPAVLGEACSVAFTPLSPSFTYRLRACLGAWEGESPLIAPGTGEAFRYTGYVYPIEAAAALPDAASGELELTLTTYTDAAGTVKAGEDRAVIPVCVPETEATRPTVSLRIAPVGPGSCYFQGLSRCSGSLAAQGQLGAEILRCEMTVAGRSYESPWLSDHLTQPGSCTVQARATDTRGFTAVAETVITVLPYGPPRLAVDTWYRTDGAGAPQEGGTGLYLEVTRSCSPAIFQGVQQNHASVSLRLKEAGTGGSFGPWQLLLPEASPDRFAGTVPGVVLEPRASYLLQLQIFDTLGSTRLLELELPGETVYMHRTKNALGLGKYAQGDRLLDCGWDAWFRGELRIGPAGQTLEEYIRKITGE